MEALRLYTVGSSWFSSEEGKKGAIVPGQLADLTVLSADYFSIPEAQIKGIESVLTIMGGKPVYAADEFNRLAPATIPILPDWSPVTKFGGYARSPVNASASSTLTDHNPFHLGCCFHMSGCLAKTTSKSLNRVTTETSYLWGTGGCDCFAF
jgi:Amidohydrolase family